MDTVVVVDESSTPIAAWQVDSSGLCGAWLIDDPMKLPNVIGNQRRVSACQETVDAVAREISKELNRVREAAGHPTIRFAALTVPDVAEIAETYRGEPAGQQSWATATALAHLNSQWQTYETQRLRRATLRERFGTTARALPWPAEDRHSCRDSD